MSELREQIGKLSPEQLQRLALRLQKRAPAAQPKVTIPKTCDAGPSPLAGGGGKSAVFSRPRYQDGVAGVVERRAG